MNTDEFLYKELTEKILNSAFKIHNSLGCGFLEKVYENALVYELKKRGIKTDQQKDIQVHYENVVVGEYTPDIVVEDKIVLEIKATKETDSIFEAQLLNYLKATKLKVGYILNFAKSKVVYKRMILSA